MSERVMEAAAVARAAAAAPASARPARKRTAKTAGITDDPHTDDLHRRPATEAAWAARAEVTAAKAARPAGCSGACRQRVRRESGRLRRPTSWVNRSNSQNSSHAFLHMPPFRSWSAFLTARQELGKVAFTFNVVLPLCRHPLWHDRTWQSSHTVRCTQRASCALLGHCHTVLLLATSLQLVALAARASDSNRVN